MCGATAVRTVLVGAGLLDAVLVDVERGVVLRDVVLEGDAFLAVIGIYSAGRFPAPINN